MFIVVFSGLKDEMLKESENLPDPNVLATNIVEDFEAVLEQFHEIDAKLGNEVVRSEKSGPSHMLNYRLGPSNVLMY